MKRRNRLSHIPLLLAGVALFPSLGRAEVTGREVTYRAGDTVLKGYLAYDDAISGKRPGVLVVHEWWGHNDYARDRARMLAELGYVALAVDMYGDGKTAEHPKDAGAFAGEVMANIDTGVERFEAAVDFLKTQEQTDTARLAAIGYCFGGAIVLHMARIGMDLDAVASFHGNLAPKAEAQEGKVKARVLVCNGADDSFVPKEQIAAFQREMNDAGVDFRFIDYPGAVHGFTNPAATALGEKFGLKLAHNESADKQSWEALKALLKEVFGK
ncbi:MAG: dienelactone hydrolase family protein [Verrucomicrobiae bacterium]|nr:dienelactone hydrolase family protein [Verrucomicrobiae bacterium]